MRVRICSLVMAMLVIVISVESSRAFASGKDRQARAKALFQTAYSASGIEAKGSAPFRLEAQFEYRGSNSRLAFGSYTELWSSPDKYMTTFSVPKGSDTNGYLNGQSWQKSTLPYTTYMETLVESAMGFNTNLKSGPPKEVKRIGKENFEKLHLTCVIPKGATADEDCFDRRNGRLMRRHDATWDVAYQYSNYRPWGNKVFPREIWIVRGSSRLVDIRIRVEKLFLPGPLGASVFAPPPGAQIVGNHPCTGKLTRAKVISKVPPKYPAMARIEMISGEVSLYADIGRSGRIRGLKVLQSPSPLLDAAAMRAVRRWRFQPTLCDGTPVEVTSQIDVIFTLKQ